MLAACDPSRSASRCQPLGATGGHAMKITPVYVLAAVLLAAMGAAWQSAAVRAQADTAIAERPQWPPPGSTWTVKLALSGSLGSGMREVTFDSLGEVDWEADES